MICFFNRRGICLIRTHFPPFDLILRNQKELVYWRAGVGVGWCQADKKQGFLLISGRGGVPYNKEHTASLINGLTRYKLKCVLVTALELLLNFIMYVIHRISNCRLCTDRGLPALLHLCDNVKFKGKGHEVLKHFNQFQQYTMSTVIMLSL